MTTGTITKVVAERGFAFARDETGNDYFVHASDLQMDFEDLSEGDRVTFESVRSPRGLKATKVRPAL